MVIRKVIGQVSGRHYLEGHGDLVSWIKMGIIASILYYKVPMTFQVCPVTLQVRPKHMGPNYASVICPPKPTISSLVARGSQSL